MTNPKALPDLPAILPTDWLETTPKPTIGDPSATLVRPEVQLQQRTPEREILEEIRGHLVAEKARLEVHGEHRAAVSPSKPKPNNKPKALTEAQKRTRKIRVWMLSQSSRPDLETYRRAMDAARILPPPACLRLAKNTFEASCKVPSLRGSISAEFSRLWRTRSPQ